MNSKQFSVYYFAAMLTINLFVNPACAANHKTHPKTAKKPVVSHSDAKNIKISDDKIQAELYKINITKSFTQIDMLLQQKKYEQAMGILRGIIDKDPANAKAITSVGKILSEQYKLDGAQKELQKAISLDPKNSDAHNALGEVLLKKTSSSDMKIRNSIDKYYAKALNEFQTAINIDPNAYKAYNNAGLVLQKQGKINEAEDYYKKALDIEPKYADALINLGDVYYLKNQVDLSLQKFQQAIESDSKNSTAYYNLGKALIAKGQYSKAINYLQTSLYLFPNSAPVHDMLGKAYEMQGNEAAAITSFRKASLIQPEYIAPYLKLADIYQNRGDSEIAISELKTALSANSGFSEAKLKIADISLEIGKYEQAINYYKDVANDKNYKDLALKGLADAYFMKAQQVSSIANMTSDSELADAESNIKKALSYNPNDLQLYLALLKLYRLTNNDVQSELYLNKIVNSSNNKTVDCMLKGEAYQSFRRYDMAKIQFSKALDETKNVEDTLNLGEILIINRQYEVAKEAFNKVLVLSPNNLKAVKSLQRIQTNEEQSVEKFQIAKSFLKSKQYDLAIESFRDCIALNPYLDQAQLMLAKTYETQGYYYNAIEHYNAYLSLITDDNEIKKYKTKVNKLSNKIQSAQNRGKVIKKFTII